MKKLHQFILCACLFFLAANGCTLDISNESSSASFTENDLLAARQIIGSSLSTNSSGVVLSINDAVNIISQTGSSSNKTPKMLSKNRAGYEFNYQSEFNPDTGIFNVSFQREVQDPLFQKMVSAKLTYLYKDGAGQTIKNPNAQRKNIASINVTASKNGELQTLSESSTFSNNDTLLITGYGDSKVSVEGTESASGTVQVNQPGGNTIKRSYNLQISLINTVFEKPAARDSNAISLALKGSMGFKLKLNQRKTPTTINGTLKTNGDGTALLQFQDSSNKYLVNLKTGEVKDLDNAFLGGVASVNANLQRVTLASGIKIFINDNTRFLNLEYRSLKTVGDRLKENIAIFANGTGNIENNKFNADQISFSEGRLDDTGNEELIAFNEFVSAVEPKGKRLTLAGQVGLQLLENTPISDSGDYNTLDEVAEGLANGELIKVMGKAIKYENGLRAANGSSILFKRYQKSK